MTTKQLKIFLGAYFSDKNVINKAVLTADDLNIPVDIPDWYLEWPKKHIYFSVPDILSMNIDCWLDLKDKEHLPYERKIKPNHFFNSTLTCIDIILQKFPDLDTSDIEYEKYTKFISVQDEDENFIDDEEMEKYKKEGYRKIDLDLINFGVKRNGRKVRELLALGANPMIDPDDKTFESEILDILAADESFHFINYISYHNRLLNHGISTFDKSDAYEMVLELYATASSSKVYNIISGLKSAFNDLMAAIILVSYL